ncbi:cellulose/xylan binding protein with CBM9 domain [Mobilisporobacter senegalensis]|uniref:Cellulose/xylan binding protein with CBM9 domain n=1 Tax=Mobilisporobacter senegalensis TaxID=1329262 RepID=A0A3N1XMH3_9FIRM|nr:carbohydrate-binding family 9-like protein [Mobilisporobacter senegalensis]ROR27388.1 cellulose/xylan binding protein with CBM9 domain [Mobilisporobacter senegalensis]
MELLNFNKKELICIYQVKTIKRIEELNHCARFQINHHLWEKEYKPIAFGQMAVLSDYGIVVSMTAMELNPLCRFYKDDDPVYKDSAMEAFLNFDLDHPEKGYLNFEMNANGAMLSEFGINRNRKKIKDLISYSAVCEANIYDSRWQVLLKIPMSLICELYKSEPLKSGDVFSCNFYKISEDPLIEHYASYAPIKSKIPNFHLPVFFDKAVIL